MGFCRYTEMGSKWVNRGFGRILTHFGTPKPRFYPLFDPFQDIDKNHLKPTLSGKKLFSKEGPEVKKIPPP